MDISANMKPYPKYKDSGVEWLGGIPEGWEVIKLRFLASIKTGDSNTEDKNRDGSYPFYVRSQIPEKSEKYLFDGESILTAGDGAGVGKVYHYVTGKFDYHQRVYKFSHFSKVKGKFLYYYIWSNFHTVATLGSAKSTVDSLRLPLISDFQVYIPTQNEQIAIASFLDDKVGKIDEAISQKEQLIQLLRERKQIIIQNAVTKGLNPNAPMKDSGIEWIGEIPEHWEIENLGSSLTPISIKNKPDYPLLSITREKGIILRNIIDQSDNHNFIPDDLSGYKMIEKGQFGMNKMKAWQGSYGVSEYTGIVSPAYYIFDFTREIYSPFFHVAIRSKLYVSFFGSASDGVRIGQWDLSKPRMKRIPIILPNIEEQKLIVKHIETQSTKITQAIHQAQQSIKTLKEYKATLINSAVTGKIRVV